MLAFVYVLLQAAAPAPDTTGTLMTNAGVVRADVAVDLANRSPADPHFAELRARLLDHLGVTSEVPA